MEHLFFKDGNYEAVGGMFVRNDLKKFFDKMKEHGLNPVGIKVDDESFNLEVIVERNDAYKKRYEKDFAAGDKVYYTAHDGSKENGIIKSINADKTSAFVVYDCNNEWDEYFNYTAVNTTIEDLSFGWIEK